ncbi:hypothetical protein VTK73DRAFT_9046 [Phialemonium thermophilum]|uniref:Uncharacterized protein n=1 Tax=Phialemonium thermophilum TaxID=223376 RepID=A0ABR3XLN2_9PEZI
MTSSTDAKACPKPTLARDSVTRMDPYRPRLHQRHGLCARLPTKVNGVHLDFCGGDDSLIASLEILAFLIPNSTMVTLQWDILV